ncbi:hypothetical protein ALC62_03553 [Cyphomyrmex costatus]|uniref:Uncharacterized protein n=1 Tax=Cyphomyrmex costatus TaxID=456900 RepID=A0A151IL86_9HYME|nr:hypothetical protein ALC62_03553 [Cyphomyrmex costatus]
MVGRYLFTPPKQNVASSVRNIAYQCSFFFLELRAPLSRDKRQATDDSSKKATAAPDPVARRPFRMIARFYVFIPGSRRARFSPRRRFCFSIANRNSFRSHFVYLCGESGAEISERPA